MSSTVGGNMAHMVKFSIKDNPTDRDLTTLNHAFGTRSYPALVEKVRFGDTTIKQKALAYLYDQFHKQENIFSAVQADLVPALINAMKDFNEGVREKAAEVFSLVASNISARSVIINQKALPVLLRALRDPSEAVRYYSHKTFATFSIVRQGAQAALDSGLVLELLSIAANLEDLDTMVLLLESLCNCAKSDPVNVLGLGAMKTILAILQKINSKPELEFGGEKERKQVALVKRLGADCLSALSAPYEGKEAATQSNDIIEILVKLTNEKRTPDVQTAALCALMNITIRTEGKWIAIKCGLPTRLLELLNNIGAINGIFILKTITNIAEDPEGRKQLQPAIPLVRQLEKKGEKKEKGDTKKSRDTKKGGDAQKGGDTLASSVKETLKQLGCKA